MDDDLPALNGNLTDGRWLTALETYAKPLGRFDALDSRHSAAFIEKGPVLIITFETTDSVRQRADRTPLGMSVAAQRNWSSLTVLTTSNTWWRSPNVFEYFDKLVDDDFFDDFDRVVFCGAGMGGYAAAAFSVAAPGASVLLVAPQATLDPSIAGWDERFRDYRRIGFSDRFGYAPDMIDAAASCHVLFDPRYYPDAMHAALFHGPATSLVPMRHFGQRTAEFADEMGITEAALLAAGDGALDMAFLYDILRLRRDHEGWLRNLLRATLRGYSAQRTEVLCKSVLSRMQSPHFSEALKQVNGG